MIGRCIRRLALLGLLAAAGAVLFTKLRSSQPAAAPTPSWPPFETSQSATKAAPATTPTAAAPVAASDVQSFAAAAAAEPAASAATAAVEEASTARWVAPVDGQCPEGYPIKANDNSGIFHVPSGRFYARTVPERCYAAAEDAVADGYRQAKA